MTAQNLERIALAAGAIVQNLETSRSPRRHLRIVTDGAELLEAEMSMVELLAPLENEAPKHQAITPRGALFQVNVAAGDLGELIGTEGWDADALRERLKRIEGCVHSVLNFIEREFSVDRNSVGGAYFANRSYVPEIWRDDERLKRV
jgi:hypothetical protein